MISKSLLNVPCNGKRAHQHFIEDCTNDPKWFESSIKKMQLKSFADAGASNRRTRQEHCQPEVYTRPHGKASCACC
ncbi:hypothetical protein E2C01_095846 [Portunus trituberculatus]|uniref:Uncharacterized protein n=1 Tax=Portunus trituberculatus TaxID=210409 RepID=A0A5B7K5C6_PORTR|nr:hypothetical protein [Portunus trituberculatus]